MTRETLYVQFFTAVVAVAVGGLITWWVARRSTIVLMEKAEELSTPSRWILEQLHLPGRVRWRRDPEG